MSSMRIVRSGAGAELINLPKGLNLLLVTTNNLTYTILVKYLHYLSSDDALV